MKLRWRVASIILVIAVWFALLISPVGAQAAGYVAFVNSSGQLVVSSADGGYRWIVTNPGESLLGGYQWAGDELFFAVDDGAGYSFRVGSVNAQNVTEIGRAAGGFYAGAVFTGDQAFVSVGGTISVYPGGSAVAGGDLPAASLGVASGSMILARGNGQYQLVGADGSVVPLGAANDPGSPYIALWSGRAPLVAYADYGFGSGLGVTNANTGETVALDDNGSIPLLPLTWAGTDLIYRGTGGVIRLVDLGCLQGGGCGDPFGASVDLLPGSAEDVHTDGSWVYFRDGESIGAVDLGCVNRGDCLNSAQTLGIAAAPETALHVGGRILIYTGYTSNPYDPADREVRAVDLGCLGNSCNPVTVSAGTAGGLDPAGNAVVVQDAVGGLSVLSLRNGSAAYLSDGGDLSEARWSS